MHMRHSIGQIRETALSLLKRSRRLLGGIKLQTILQFANDRLAHYAARSLANRILLLQLIWMLVIYILVIAALWVAASLVIESSVRHQGENWIAKLDEQGIPLYATNNPAQLKHAVGLQDLPEVAQVRYLDETGKKTIAEYSRKDVAIGDFPPLTDDVIKNLGRVDTKQKTLLFETNRNSQMRICAPIWIKSISGDGMFDYSLNKTPNEKIKVIGFIELVLDYSRTTSDLNHNIFFASLIIAALMLIASVVARIVVQRALRPLSELEEPLTRLANGETDITVSTAGDEEIARIGVALNTTISALKERDETLRQMADHDALTGLPNRRLLADRLKQAIVQAHRTGKTLSVCYIDLDGFKQVNDQHGHAAGDQLLVEVTGRLQETIRAGDTLARLGGDEFAVLLNDLTGKDECFQILDRMLYAAAMPVSIGSHMVTVSASIGVAFYISGSEDCDTLLRHADQAMYEAKQAGKSRYHLYSHNACLT
jgi:diguanylate cyclase (GGDEF)-like protein